MKIFRELRIRGPHTHLAKLMEYITTQLTSDWCREIEDEASVRRQVSSELFCFQRSTSADRPGALLWIAYHDPTELYVSNVVPSEAGSLTYDEYNSIVEEFYRIFVLPAAPSHSVSVDLGRADVGLEEWLDGATAKYLATFSACANKSTGAGHPLDQQRWYEFIISAHITHADLHPDTLARWLHEQEGWSDSMASDLAIDYEKARALLRAYDSVNG